MRTILKKSSAVGIIMGFIFGQSGRGWQEGLRLNMSQGSFNIIRYGAGPNGPMRTLGQYMLGSGATFGYAVPCNPVAYGHCNAE